MLIRGGTIQLVLSGWLRMEYECLRALVYEEKVDLWFSGEAVKTVADHLPRKNGLELLNRLREERVLNVSEYVKIYVAFRLRTVGFFERLWFGNCLESRVRGEATLIESKSSFEEKSRVFRDVSDALFGKSLTRTKTETAVRKIFPFCKTFETREVKVYEQVYCIKAKHVFYD
jgi:hypothetical protein